MRSTIDSAGRLVIPKDVRREAGLRSGMPVEVIARNGRVEIEPAPLPVRLVKKGRLLVAVPATAYRVVLGNAPISGIAGGRIYDEVIGACCLRGRATTLLTFNVGHFESFRARGLDVVVPAD